MVATAWLQELDRRCCKKTLDWIFPYLTSLQWPSPSECTPLVAIQLQQFQHTPTEQRLPTLLWRYGLARESTAKGGSLSRTRRTKSCRFESPPAYVDLSQVHFSYSVSLLVSSPGCLDITCYSLDTLNHSLLSILCNLALFQSRPSPSNPTKRDSGPTRKTPNPLLTTCIRQTRPRYSLIVPRNSRPTTLPPNH